MTEAGGEVGSAVLPYLADQGHSEAPWWLVVGIGVVMAGLMVWALLRRGGAR